MNRPIEELQEDIRTLTRICGFAINDKLNEIAEEVGEIYQKGRTDAIEELKDDYANCEGANKCANCMFSRYGKISCIFGEGQDNE